jgi:type IV pilus assembly protein PilQ
MRALRRGTLAGTLVTICVATGFAVAADTEEGAATAGMAGEADASILGVDGVRIERDGGGRALRIELSREPDALTHFVLDSPPRVVVDLRGPLAGSEGREERFPVDDDLVERVRVAPFKGKLRVVLDLTRDARDLTVAKQGDALVAVLAEPLAAGAPAGEMETAEVEIDAPAEAATDPPSGLLAALPLATEPTILAAAVPTPASASTPVPRLANALVAEAPVLKEEKIQKGTDDAPPAEALSPGGVDVFPARNQRKANAPGAEVEVVPPAPTPVSAEKVDLPPPPAIKKSLIAPDAPPVVDAKPRVAKPSGVVAQPGERISLDFKDADVQNVLRVLADVSNLNIIATDDVRGKVTLRLHDVPWDQALDLVLKTNRLEASRDGNVVRVSTVKRLKEERDSLKLAEDAERELEPLRVAYQRVNYARADEALVDKVKGVLTERGSVTFDERTNTVIVRDIQRGIVSAEGLLRELDVQSPQVMIEAHIVEATEAFGRALGVQWGYGYKAGPETGNPTGMNFPGTVGLGGSGLGAGVPPPANGSGAVPLPVPFLADFPVPSNFGSGFGPGAGSALDLALGSLDGTQTISARLTAMEEQGKGKVVSRPRVITMNNVAATIQSLTILRVKLPSTGTVINTGAGGAAGGNQTATEKINTGITLVVTPQVSADGFVLMSIYAKSSKPDFSRSVDGIPNEISREANSNVLIRNGETVVLGGIFRQETDENESGIPYLRKVPALGWLFKRKTVADRHDELLVFLTPKVVDPGSMALPPARRLWENRNQG